MQRTYATQSMQVEVGDDGRIVLPPKARGGIGLADLKDGAETVFAGVLGPVRDLEPAGLRGGCGGAGGSVRGADPGRGRRVGAAARLEPED